MTNTLHENGHWIAQDNKLDNLIDNTINLNNREMDRNLSSSTNQQQINQEQELNDTNDDNEDEQSIDESEISSLNVSLNELATKKNDPYASNRLGCTSPIVLEHIEEAIDYVVKNFYTNKDLSSTLNSSNNISNNNNSSNNINKSSKQSTTIKTKTKKKKIKKPINNYHSFDLDLPFELNNKKKKTDQSTNKKKDNQFGPFIKIDKKKNQLNYLVINSQSKQDDKEIRFFKDNTISNFSSLNKINKTQQSNDNTWICIFCKRSPHYKKLGDLFGPYELNNNKDNSDLPSTSNGLSTNNEIDFKEIWFHEDCIIWSNGIYLAGNRLRNLDEVVLECSEITCSECKLKGANLGCVQKGCNQTFHFICAKNSGCELDEENFSMFCQNHKKSTNPIE